MSYLKDFSPFAAIRTKCLDWSSLASEIMELYFLECTSNKCECRQWCEVWCVIHWLLSVSIEEDFITWKDRFWPHVCEKFGIAAVGEDIWYVNNILFALKLYFYTWTCTEKCVFIIGLCFFGNQIRISIVLLPLACNVGIWKLHSFIWNDY